MDAELEAMSVAELRNRLATAEADLAAAGPEDVEWARDVHAAVKAQLDQRDGDAPERGDTVIELRDRVPWISIQKVKQEGKS